MPKEHERPGMFAPREAGRPRHISQPLTHGRVACGQQDQHGYCEPHNCDPSRMRPAALQTQVSYHGTSAHLSPFVPAKPMGHSHPTRIVQQPQATSQQSCSAKRASRRSRAVNRVVYTCSFNGAPPQHVFNNTKQGLEQIGGHSCFAGYTPLHPDPPVIVIQSSSQQKAALPSFQQRPQMLAPPRAHVSYRQSSASCLPPSGLLHHYHDKHVPVPPTISEVNPPDADTWSVTVNRQIARPHHRELFYDEQTLFPPQCGPAPLPRLPTRAKLEGYQPSFTIPEPTSVRSTRLDTGDCLGRPRGIQRIGPRPGNVRVQQQQHLLRTAEPPAEPPVLPEIALDRSLSRCNEEAPSTMTWYEFYKRKRTWEFEDLRDAYERILEASGSKLGGSEESTESKSH